MTLAELNNTNTEVDLTDLDLKITDFENVLNVYNVEDHWLYNLNSKMNIDIDSSLLYDYTCNADMHWPIISYNIYGTTRLAWLLMKINNVKIKDSFACVEASNTVKYISKENLRTLLSEMQQYSS